MAAETKFGPGGRAAHRRWLKQAMNPYFFVSMRDEPDALAMLERELDALGTNRRIILADRDNALILALVNRPGTLYETLRRLHEREISYAMIAHSDGPLPGMDRTLEIQRFEFDRRSNREILDGEAPPLPTGLRRRIRRAVIDTCPDFDRRDFDRLLRLLWLNNDNYVRTSPPARVAQLLRLFQKGNRSGGFHLGFDEMPGGLEYRVLFAVGNPPQKDFLLQVMEIFNRLDLGVNRAYCLTVNNGHHPYFLGTFYVRRRDGGPLTREGALFRHLHGELAATQVLATRSPAYRELVATRVIGGEEGALMNVFIAFCHSNLAHCRPDRFGIDDVQSAFLVHPEISQQLAALFRARFDPELAGRDESYPVLLAAAQQAVAAYNTGHRYLDEVRRTIFRCCLLFITHTLKTNFFVPGKQAVAFRLDPAYLAALGPEATADLPAETPFRVSFFFSRYGFGYHIGFSDIARGGWRTVPARTPDDYVTATDNLFRECFVLAHTQHLKNKDIYEGGSKLVTVLDLSDLKRDEQDLAEWRLYKLQYGMANAFLDIFTTRDGTAQHPQVVDYYREDEPIELGPDENMSDIMIEAIAGLSRRRGYLLGIGLISSKRVGINHKEYGVTSTGVVTFAEIVMAGQGIDIRRDPFSVKLTGGPNGDVAGNAIRILLERSPRVSFRLILDGTAALADPRGADHGELRRILLKADLDAFSPDALNPGAVLLYRSGSRREGLRELYRRVTRREDGLEEEWVSADDFAREYGALPFTVPADLFIPAGGRPETIDATTWESYFLPDGRPSARVIVEGANSYITPEARLHLQRLGVTIMRDAAANKCGVISSSYEIIANLLLKDEEFLAVKERYVRDVLEILEQRAGDEARLILRRRQEQPGLLCTDISDSISREINGHYARLFRYFQERPHLGLDPFFRRVILAHLPRMFREEPALGRRLGRLPAKYRAAMLAAEIGASLVYRGDREAAYEDQLRLHVLRSFPEVTSSSSQRIRR
jgi:glutamate dehydrogenase